ncbi:MAG: S8 family serine peptidase [Candidatus Dormibacteraeota bacterium]|nr:S8 family serine peptidase [Candidatus Dormibacteraeota bacterium]
MIAAAIVVGAALLPVAGTVASLGAQAGASVATVIVAPVPGHEAQATAAIVAAGGHVTNQVALIDATVATVPSNRAAWLSRQPGVADVTPDAGVQLMSGGTVTQSTAHTLTATLHDIGVDRAWSQGYTGQGVGVALIDSGVAAVNGLTAPGKVVNGPDLSTDASSPALRYTDGFGHGTHMAGIIAGREDAATGHYATDTTDFLGAAPDAHIVNVKVASANGSSDLVRILLALDWIVRHHSDPGLNIRVVSLSFGTKTTLPYVFDPLTYAAEAAWHNGIVVVASAGNAGASAAGLTDPAMDPFVIAVGATRDARTAAGGVTFTAAPFSSAGTTARTPDVAAPGTSIMSLRAPGSYIDTHYPGARVGTRFFLGSGTSQATAMTAGVAALIVSKYPNATPDQVKDMLVSTATSVAGGSKLVDGAGEILANAALAASPRPVTQNFPVATMGMGGGGQAAPSTGSWSTGSWSTGSWSSTSWASSSWSTGSWSSSSWSSGSWSSSSWSSSSWS